MNILIRSIRTLLISTFIVAGTASLASCQSTPVGRVQDFGLALKAKDVKSLVPFVTNEPDYVAELAYREYLRIHPQVYDTKSSRPANSVEVSPSRPSRTGEELVKYVVPTDLFFDQNRTVTEILESRLDVDEAVVRVALGGFSSQNGEQYTPLIYDILLIRERGSWKIFRLIARRKGDEKWYQYSFYANPHS